MNRLETAARCHPTCCAVEGPSSATQAPLTAAGQQRSTYLPQLLAPAANQLTRAALLISLQQLAVSAPPSTTLTLLQLGPAAFH